MGNKEEEEPISDIQEYSELTQARSPLSEKVVYELADKLFDAKIISMITRLNNEQMKEISKVILVDKFFFKRYINPKSSMYNSVDELLCEFMKLFISEGGKSRDEIVNMVSGLRLTAIMSNKQKPILGH